MTIHTTLSQHIVTKYNILRMQSVLREWHETPLCQDVDFDFEYEGAKGPLRGLQHPVCGVGEEETGEAGA